MRKLVVILAGLAVGLAGCADRRFIDVGNGVGMRSRDVQQYAVKHNMTYDQALAALRKESDDFWIAEEAKQARSKPKATKAAEITPAKQDPAPRTVDVNL